VPFGAVASATTLPHPIDCIAPHFLRHSYNTTTTKASQHRGTEPIIIPPQDHDDMAELFKPFYLIFGYREVAFMDIFTRE
jgi:hypothetical protein